MKKQEDDVLGWIRPLGKALRNQVAGQPVQTDVCQAVASEFCALLQAQPDLLKIGSAGLRAALWGSGLVEVGDTLLGKCSARGGTRTERRWWSSARPHRRCWPRRGNRGGLI